MSELENTSATLYVVATPIGNLGDMTTRAVEVLRSVDIIAAEDTRHSARLMQHFAITTRMTSYHDFSDDSRVEALLAQLRSGLSIALISDAGTPLISDPGYRLVQRAREAGLVVVPVPGASALTAALSAAGLPSDRFVFEGFPAAKRTARLKHFSSLVDEIRTLIFYESPHRILESLADMREVFGAEREVAICRELTKTFETIRLDRLGVLEDWIKEDDNRQRGEFVLIVRGAPVREMEAIEPETLRILEILLEDLSVKQAAQLAARISGVKKNLLYERALQLIENK
jgi:16S rRNA (cytidine1402-2'-O)-methyltransferase